MGPGSCNFYSIGNWFYFFHSKVNSLIVFCLGFGFLVHLYAMDSPNCFLHGPWIPWLFLAGALVSLIVSCIVRGFPDFFRLGLWILWLLPAWALDTLIASCMGFVYSDCFLHGLWILWLLPARALDTLIGLWIPWLLPAWAPDTDCILQRLWLFWLLPASALDSLIASCLGFGCSVLGIWILFDYLHGFGFSDFFPALAVGSLHGCFLLNSGFSDCFLLGLWILWFLSARTWDSLNPSCLDSRLWDCFLHWHLMLNFFLLGLGLYVIACCQGSW